MARIIMAFCLGLMLCLAKLQAQPTIEFPSPGIWYGLGWQEGVEWTIRIECEAGQDCRVYYRDLGCWGVWKFGSKRPNGSLRMTEYIRQQPPPPSAGCHPIVRLEIRVLNPLLLSIKYTTNDGLKAYGVLVRHFPPQRA